MQLFFAPDEPALARDYYILPLGTRVPLDAGTFMVPCSRPLDDVRSNPACPDEAHAEARDRWTAHSREAAA
jgi:hypothetical protein